MPRLSAVKQNDISSWSIINDPDIVKQLSNECDELSIWDMNGRDAIVVLGYKVLSAADKETYFALKGLAKMKDDKGRIYTKVSLDYLSIMLGTTGEGQRKRIQKLEKYGLVRIVSRARTSNTYFVTEKPLPDTTYVDTINRLIKRKRILGMINAMQQNNNVVERLTMLKELSILDPDGIYFPKDQLLDIANFGNPLKMNDITNNILEGEVVCQQKMN